VSPAGGGAAPAAPPPAPAGAEVLRVDSVSRSFGETRALRSCSLTLRAGEVHAVMGENGSGKSTLVKVVSGILAPDDGTITIGGRTLTRIASPRVARELGIATVFQEVLVVEPLTVLDNVWLGADGEFKRRVPDERKRAEAAAVLADLAGEPLPLGRPVELLELSDRQVCVIARALVQRPRVLVLDESTSALDVSTRDRLFAAVRRLCAEGACVVFISHRMDEVEEIADRVTVLRSGDSVGTLERGEATPDEILRLMSGAEVQRAGARARASGEQAVVLRASGVRVEQGTAPIDLELRRGEIVGLAGLEGHGQEAFLRVLAGLEPPASGAVTREGGRAGPVRSLREASRRGIAYVPRDRKTEGIFEPLSIMDNFSLPTLERDEAPGGLVVERSRRRRLRRYVEALRIRLGGSRDRITTLSGGNQQKVIIARWLAMEPDVIVLNDPTRGVDHATKQDIYRLLGELAAAGTAVVMLSTEVEEHLALMDRVLVFREGHLFEEIDRERLSRERLIAGFFGRRLTEAEAGT
jgi:ABC-type sugar transport system ATPase subunit